MGRKATNIKNKLIETAVDLIWSSSYGSVSVEDICQAAGAQKGSFYYYFESKSDLALHALDAHATLITELYNEIFGANIPAVEKLECIAELIYQKQREGYEKYGHVCGCAFASLGSEVAGHEEAIRTKTEEIMKAKIANMGMLIRQIQSEGMMPSTYNPAEKAAEIQSYIIGRMTLAKMNNSLESLRDLQEGMFSILNITTNQLEPA